MKSTKYAPAERVGNQEIVRDSWLLQHEKPVGDLLNSLSSMAGVLNEYRQIVFSNVVLTNATREFGIEKILGLRPGEAINCVHSRDESGGCGTSEHCRYCGAVNTILKSQQSNKRVSDECRITSRRNDSYESFDFHVTAAPLEWNDRKYTLLSLTDISHEKRRKALERIFFHDVLNTSGSLSGFIELIKNTGELDRIMEYAGMAGFVAESLIEELLAYRTITEAENHELVVENVRVNTLEMIRTAVDNLLPHPCSNNKQMKIDHDSADLNFMTDPRLLGRIMNNMIKNALESSEKGDSVEIGCKERSNRIVFWVKNLQVMSNDVKMQVFNRSFSTRGKDRGLGTYSIRLLGEGYLKGKVYFTSEESSGTIFYIELPLTKN